MTAVAGLRGSGDFATDERPKDFREYILWRNPNGNAPLTALLSKMAQRGQIRGGLVDGPLAMDNAVDLAAARTKGINSEVAGQAGILVVPGIDAGNMLAKQLTYISHAEAAGLVLGARVPVILNSRADSSKSRLASCAVAALHHARLNGINAGPIA